MRKKKITRDEAAEELYAARTAGFTAGMGQQVDTWSRQQSPYNSLPGAWFSELRVAWNRGYEDGQARRKAELEFVTEAEVDRRVAAAIADLPECRPVEVVEPVNGGGAA